MENKIKENLACGNARLLEPLRLGFQTAPRQTLNSTEQTNGQTFDFMYRFSFTHTRMCVHRIQPGVYCVQRLFSLMTTRAHVNSKHDYRRVDRQPSLFDFSTDRRMRRTLINLTHALA